MATHLCRSMQCLAKHLFFLHAVQMKSTAPTVTLLFRGLHPLALWSLGHGGDKHGAFNQLTSVHAHMLDPHGVGEEAHRAEVAFVRADVVVLQLMQSQITVGLEGGGAAVALVRALVRVGAHVPRQLPMTKRK